MKKETGYSMLDAGYSISEGRCEDCEYSMRAVGPGELVLTCDHKKPSNRIIVEAGDFCEKFIRSRELVGPALAEALAEGAKLIPLTMGKVAIVDAEDYERLNEDKWYAIKTPYTYYAGRTSRRKHIRMHREIMRAPRHLVCDHRDHNGLDNRKSNLRLCTQGQNLQNRRGSRGKTSRHKGVYYCRRDKVFGASICLNSKRYRLGYFKNEDDVGRAYDKKVIELFGEFAFLNFPDLATVAVAKAVADQGGHKGS